MAVDELEAQDQLPPSKKQLSEDEKRFGD